MSVIHHTPHGVHRLFILALLAGSCGFAAAFAQTAPAQKPLPAPPAPAVTEDQNRPSTTSRPNPYPDLPSLQDLYRQVPGPGMELRRFGAEIFVNGTGNLENLPMDLPAGPDYTLGPGDGLNVDLWGGVVQHISGVVDRGGSIALPEAGALQVAGYTLAQAQDMIRKALSTQFKDVRIDVSLGRLRTVRIYVVGDVVRPGAYDVNSLSTPLNALYAAGGATERGSLRSVRHYRGRQLVREVDLYELILQGVRSDVERLQPGDTLLVPTVGPQVAVAGMVRRPAVYELKTESELAEVLELAGGVLVSAALRQIHVERIEAHQRRTLLSLQLPEGEDHEVLKKILGGFRVQDGDRVSVFPILPYSEKTVYLQGHVFFPGKYPFRDGMRLRELIGSYQDLLPEPADHAEIIRLMPPDYRPTLLEFRLQAAMGDGAAIILQPFDTVRIFGRYEIDPPKAQIFGEVLRPGEYPLTAGMSAAALVRMAGGFKRSALTATADITSYEVQNGQKVVTNHRLVEIGKALAGDLSADAPLKPGDVVTIRQLAGWRDIGSSVRLEGEVLYPGTYGIEEGERLSSLLQRAGGFRAGAYAQGSVLERVQVRELAERNRQELIRRAESEALTVKMSPASSAQDQAELTQAMAMQRQNVLAALRNQPASGRLVINISSEISRWQNTGADIQLRPGDVLFIPKLPGFVMVSGQVYNPTAIIFARGKNAEWYLRQAGGVTRLADKGQMYVIRANGSVLGRRSGRQGWWNQGVEHAILKPGDMIVVPEKFVGRSAVWKNVLETAQFISATAIAARVATSF